MIFRAISIGWVATLTLFSLTSCAINHRRALPASQCESHNFASTIAQSSMVVALKHGGVKEQFVLVNEWHNGTLTSIGINPIGAKLFESNWNGREFDISTAALIAPDKYEHIVQAIHVVSAYQNHVDIAPCVLTVTDPGDIQIERTSARYTDLHQQGQHTYFNIPYLEYNVSFSVM